MKIWTEFPAKTDVDATIRHYFSLLQAEKIAEAEQVVDHTPVRHVLTALWKGSVGVRADEDTPANAWEQDLSFLGELDLADFVWGHGDGRVYVKLTYRAQTIEVALEFWVKETDAGWVLSGPATLW